ncbi:MAG: GntR family transcriptional regulator [Burkholderiales bacterium]|jgi:DNA-binding GntR family transcriptional regulator
MAATTGLATTRGEAADGTAEAGNAVERTCAGIVALIERGRLVGGSPLGEVELAARLSVARSTVREALARLESRGLAVRGGGRGLVVRRLDRKDVADLYALREQLEGLAARLAAERQAVERPWTRARIADERRRWRALLKDGSLPAFGDANRAFHRAVIDAAGNRHLPDMLERTLMTLFASQFRAWVATPDTVRAATQHLELIDAIEAGDAAAAERAMRAHVRDSAAMILRLEDAAFD